MNEFTIRRANIKDIDFLIETIIEAEKAGTNILSYSTVFDLSKSEVEHYLKDILLEDVDGCELSVSNYLVAEQNELLIAASCAWVEGSEGIPSSILKGNLLNYFLPKRCIERAIKLNPKLQLLQFEYKPNAIHFGVGYVKKEYRGNNLLGILKQEQINYLIGKNSNISEAFVEIFGNNLPAIKTNLKLGFEINEIKESADKDIFLYLPDNTKLLLKKMLT